MVRFKNRYLLIEFLTPSSLTPFPSVTSPSAASCPNADLADDNDDNEDDEDEEVALGPIPDLPFLVPLPDLALARARAGGNHGEGGDGGANVFKAVRTIVQDVFGDEGWGRIASSFKVIYHSPLTTLTLVRVARPHYRLLWASLTLLTSLGPGRAVLPRVVAVSGTIKKCQNRAIAYHRLVIARAVSVLGAEAVESAKLDIAAEQEQTTLASIED